MNGNPTLWLYVLMHLESLERLEGYLGRNIHNLSHRIVMHTRFENLYLILLRGS